MPILNYTTSVGIDRSAAQIQKSLTRVGVRGMSFEYDDDGAIFSMMFRLDTERGPVNFRLPANVRGVLAAMEEDRAVPRRLCREEQAARVAWRIIKDWIEAQVAIVEAGQAEAVEVFLPYALDQRGNTLFQALETKGFPGLTYKENGS